MEVGNKESADQLLSVQAGQYLNFSVKISIAM